MTDNSHLLVYRASAGSGKTFTLAVEYIKQLILDPYAYRHILAVTFTNKATAEMKERILSQLYGIAHRDPKSKCYFNKIKESTGLPDQEITEAAGKAPADPGRAGAQSAGSHRVHRGGAAASDLQGV